jgi:hypothetical protein
MSSPFQKKDQPAEPNYLPPEANDASSAPFTPSQSATKSKERAADKALAIKNSVKDALEKQSTKVIQGITEWDWHKIPPPVMVEILKRTPMRGNAGEPDYYLEEYQAYRFAIRSYELGLSPLSTEVWYNRKNQMTNVTFEGKLRLAQLRNLNLSPPKLERIPEDESKPLIAYKCTIQTPSGPSMYTAMLKEWIQPTSPVWREKPSHMLQIRASEKCLSLAMGIGSSELMGEQDLLEGAEAAKVLPSVESTNFEYKEMENKQ